MPAIKDKTSRPLRVLLCGDHGEHQDPLVRALAGGHTSLEVTVVRGIERLIPALGRDRFDCVILDCKRGGGLAPGVLQRAARVLGDSPVLLIGIGHERRAAIEGEWCGVVDFIPASDALRGAHLLQRVMASIDEARQQRMRDERRSDERRDRYLARASETDRLTGLYNRGYFGRWLRQGRWKSDRRRYQCCVMVGIDHGKRINGERGHAFGDQVIRAVGRIVREHTGLSGVAVRWGGQRFLAVHPLRDPADCQLHAERLRKKIAQAHISSGDARDPVTVSVGVMHVRSEALSAQTVHRVGQAMHLATSRGGDKVCSWQTVEIDRVLSDLSTDRAGGPERHRRRFLAKVRSMLGPTQWEHMTRHGAKVSDTACRIAHAMGVGLADIERLRIGALLHDVGKCLVPERLLAKPRSLAVEEWELISQHAELGAWIASRLGAESETAKMILHHHTRYDSVRGGLLIDRVLPLGARILCVADALVTMTTNRAYRSRMSFVQALGELQRERGRQFDPGVVDMAWFARDQSLMEAA